MAGTLDFGKLEALIYSGQLQEFYSEIKIVTGFKYPDLALGIVTGDSVAGEVAVMYMKKQAEDYGISLGDAQVEDVKLAMAENYLRALSRIADENNGVVSRDISAGEALTLHNDAFTSLGLPVECWTLYVPFTILSADDAQENWESFLANAASTTVVSEQNLLNFLDAYFGNTLEVWWDSSLGSNVSFSNFFSTVTWTFENFSNLLTKDDLSRYLREQVLQV